MKEDFFIHKIENLRINKNGEREAPHKPLFLLLLLKKIQDGHKNEFTYDEIANELSALLKKFNQSKTIKPQYPFVFLDEYIWSTNVGVLKFKDSPSLKEVLGKKGSLNQEFFQLLTSNDQKLQKFSDLIIKKYFTRDRYEELNNWMNE